MNELTIDQRLKILEDQINQEQLAKTEAKEAKQQAINNAYNYRVAEHKERIINAHHGIY